MGTPPSLPHMNCGSTSYRMYRHAAFANAHGFPSEGPVRHDRGPSDRPPRILPSEVAVLQEEESGDPAAGGREQLPRRIRPGERRP